MNVILQPLWRHASRLLCVSQAALCVAVCPSIGALRYSVEVTEAGKGMSRRGTGDEQVVSGDVLRKLLVQMETRAQVSPAERAREVVHTRVGRVRQRAPAAAKSPVHVRDSRACVSSRAASGRIPRVPSLSYPT